MTRALTIAAPVELKPVVLPYGRMPLNQRDCLVAQKVYRHEDVRTEPPEPELDKRA
jgi:hypothetical protein